MLNSVNACNNYFIFRRYIHEEEEAESAWFYGLDLLSELRQDLKQICFQAVICNLKYRLIWSVVYRYNAFWVFHSCEMLHSAWNPNSNVEIRGNNFSSLTYLHLIRAELSIYSSSWGSYSSISESICQFIDDLEILSIFDSSAAWNHNSCCSELRLVAITLLLSHKRC